MIVDDFPKVEIIIHYLYHSLITKAQWHEKINF